MTRTTLDHEQIGHLRHWDNLSHQQPNDWSMMQGKGCGQDDFGGYRFQLAYMIYGLALTHRHRLPAAPGLFRPTMQRLIEKLLLPEVWMYWRDVSRGGSVFNAHLAGSLHEEWDPVVRDNIMYSAYVQSCALLHDHLFASDRYATPGSLTFRHWSFFWGGQEKRFAYDRDSLNDHLYWQMVQNGYIGVACEPNCVFQICNQPAILGFRLHDLLTGGDRADEVVAGYERAWADFGRLDAGGHYAMMVSEDSRAVRPNDAPSPWVDAWCGALMNTWNRDFVHRHYPEQVTAFLVPGPDGTISVCSAPAREVMGQRIVSDTCDTGWVAAWASEMGDAGVLDGLLAHTDRHMNPTWRDGGLYYPRNDTPSDADGHRTEIEPMSGNVLLGYARLNVPDGLWGIYNRPWGPGHFTEPALTVVDRDIEVSRAEVVEGVLHARLRRITEVPGDGTVTIGRVPGGARLTLGGTEISTTAGEVVVPIPTGPALDLVLTPVNEPVAFDLVDHHGTLVTAATYRGRWLLVQFGFTSCRMVCPRALAKLDTALEGFDDEPLPLYITVDPDRDTPEVMRDHLQASHPRFTGLTGTPEQIEKAKQAFQIFARRRPDAEDPDGYAVPHTAITHLVDPHGHRVTHWGDAVAAERIRADLVRRI